MASTDTDGYITFSSKANGRVVQIPLAQNEIFDSVYYHTLQCYSYLVLDPNKDLTIRLDSFSGNPDVYIDPHTDLSLKQDVGNSLYFSRDHFNNEELILTPAERKA